MSGFRTQLDRVCQREALPKFPIHRDLLGFDFGQSKVDQPLAENVKVLVAFAEN